MTFGTAAIAFERERQIAAEGYTVGHDARHRGGELVTAAAVYLNTLPPSAWPWPDTAPKVDPDAERPTLDELVRAGALIAAEIDRRAREAR